MTRLDAIKAREQATQTAQAKCPWPHKTYVEEDRTWLLAQVEALAGAAKALRDAYIVRIGTSHTHPTGSYDFLPEYCARCLAERQTTVALTGVQTALAALEAQDASV